jgi:hypothetical protein
LSELKRYSILDVDGNPVDSEGLAGEWLNLTIRDILPLEFDNVLQLLDNFAESLIGIVGSSGTALTRYINFLKGKVERLLNITKTVKSLVQRLLQYRLEGNILLLNIPPEAGGMQRFVSRFNSAVIELEDVASVIPTPDDREPVSNIDALEGIFLGVGVVYGFPDFSTELSERFIPEEQKQQYKKQLERFQTALKTYQKILGLEE